MFPGNMNVKILVVTYCLISCDGIRIKSSSSRTVKMFSAVCLGQSM